LVTNISVCECNKDIILIKLSEKLMYESIKILKETILHEMIHAYLYIKHNILVREGLKVHGDMFKYHMNRINENELLNINTIHKKYNTKNDNNNNNKTRKRNRNNKNTYNNTNNFNRSKNINVNNLQNKINTIKEQNDNNSHIEYFICPCCKLEIQGDINKHLDKECFALF